MLLVYVLCRSEADRTRDYDVAERMLQILYAGGLFTGFVVALFSTVLLLYANSFVMKRRQKELGLYNILGLEKRHIAALCFWEMLLCAAVVIPGGIAAGILLSKLILLLLLKLVQIPVQFGFSVSVRGVGETAALLGVLFLLGTALSIALAAPTKTAAAGLGRKGANDVLIEQLVGIDMLARGRFHRSGRLDNVLDGLFDSLGKLLLSITYLGMNGIRPGTARYSDAPDGWFSPLQ